MILKIDEKSNLANYLQLMNQIKEKIFLGELTINDQLPSIRVLAKDLNIAIITVKRAYDELEKEGFIETRQGKGCFVKKLHLDQLKEKKLLEIEKNLNEIIHDAKQFGLSDLEITNLIKKILEE
ncbi:GntR family transcriptional regulator [Anaerorhabdus furcosa]|uniref:Transcriptional regulator, GntR family n=1 Tax=Anaerorhabdus furcosa TaxID=118967 RepID=A0A1T4PK34_9FIRM|nr:GntR family transcriptional regulator [Anaerorhabdus furcosa]SJZ91586.1 transcriptional regulator, GntR family [Anaerorhabdus furcosa]